MFSTKPVSEQATTALQEMAVFWSQLSMRRRITVLVSALVAIGAGFASLFGAGITTVYFVGCYAVGVVAATIGVLAILI